MCASFFNFLDSFAASGQPVDSKTVSRAIKEHIHPVLGEMGFQEFTSRSAWRYSEKCIDVVNFQSFNRHAADEAGITTFSFSINLGRYFTFAPQVGDIEEKAGRLRPEEHLCHLRRRLHKSLRQKNCSFKDIWMVDENGRNLAQVIADASRAIHEEATEWFTRFDSLREVLRTLTEDEESDIVYGMGPMASPMRDLLAGCTALELNRPKEAETSLRLAQGSGCFPEIEDTLSKLIADTAKAARK